MRILQYGEWKIAVDIEKTKQYYENYKKNDTQANRNFTKYCEKLSNEEQEFFNSLAITPECCEIEHIGVSKKGDFPCGGYYLVCGKYFEYPPENLMTVEELAENDFIDERPDQRIQIGLFQFDFQVDSYQFNEIPENIPDGFICIRFWCEEMKWLLNENPEEIMYEPPHFWELHKIIKEKIEEKKIFDYSENLINKIKCRKRVNKMGFICNGKYLIVAIPKQILIMDSQSLTILQELTYNNETYNFYPSVEFNYTDTSFCATLENDVILYEIQDN